VQAEGSSGFMNVSVGKFCPDNETRRGRAATLGKQARTHQRRNDLLQLAPMSQLLH
jgi:hypothetical protein